MLVRPANITVSLLTVLGAVRLSLSYLYSILAGEGGRSISMSCTMSPMATCLRVSSIIIILYLTVTLRGEEPLTNISFIILQWKHR